MTPFQSKYGPWALIAGASEGLGAAFARQLAERGLNVALVARRSEVLNALSAEIEGKYRVSVRTLAVDLSTLAAAGRIVESFADLEVGLLIHNAAHAPSGAFLELSLEENLRAVDLNVRAPVALAHAFGRKMAQRKRGGIVLMSSLTAFQGSPFLATYGATKAFNLVLAEGLWFELREAGVDALAVCAGATRTPKMIQAMPQGAPGMLEPEAVAANALATLGRRPLTIPGAFNKLASFMMRRILSRRSTIALMGGQAKNVH